MENITLPPHIRDPNPQIYLSKEYITYDLETTNIEFGSALNRGNSIICGARKAGKVRCELDWFSEFNSGSYFNHVIQADFQIAHNAKFELQWGLRCGEDLTQVVVWDTMIAEYCIAGNRRWKLDLDSVAKRWGVGKKGSVVSGMIKSGICPSLIPPRWLAEYCKQDVVITEAVFQKQLAWILENNPELLNVIYTRCLLTPVLADIEFNGVYLSKERVNVEYNKYNKELSELNRSLDDYAGGINWNSPSQVADYLYDGLGFTEPTDRRGNPLRTPGGKRSASSPVIAKLRANNNKQKTFLRLYSKKNKVKAALDKTLEFFKGVIDEKNCQFTAQFNQCITRTHRLSSSGRRTIFKRDNKGRSVQFQNLARIFKRLVTTRYKDWKIGEIDGAQIEFRVAAFSGRDTQASADISAKYDIHRYTASILNGCSENEVTHDQRQDAKSDTFKPLYGGTSGTKIQQAYYKAFREKYKGITETQRGWVDTVLATKQLKTETGLVYYWPDTYMSRSGYIKNNESIHNYPIQMLATADIVPIALVYLWHGMKASGMESFIINTVHDSVIAELNPGEEELYEDIAVKAFTDDVYNYLNSVYDIQFSIELGAGVKIGNYWGEGEEKKYSVVPQYKLVK